MTTQKESIKSALSSIVDPCYQGCNHHYEEILNIPWRVYCKKGCKGDGDNWNDCKEECRETCYKDPIISGDSKLSNFSASFDRSPGKPSQSMRCFKACLWGCAARFNVPDESYIAAISKDPSLEHHAQVSGLPVKENAINNPEANGAGRSSVTTDEKLSPVSEASDDH